MAKKAAPMLTIPELRRKLMLLAADLECWAAGGPPGPDVLRREAALVTELVRQLEGVPHIGGPEGD
jgi:hypothetical protein